MMRDAWSNFIGKCATARSTDWRRLLPSFGGMQPDYTQRTMRRISAAALVVFLFVLAMACGGSDSPTLQLRTGPITEDAFRVQVRQTAFLTPGLFDVICSGVNGSSTDGPSTADFMQAFQRINPFATVVRPLEYHSADASRAVQIIAEECESLT